MGRDRDEPHSGRTQGRVVPLAWITVRKDALKDRMRTIEFVSARRPANSLQLRAHFCGPIGTLRRSSSSVAWMP